MDVSAMLTGAQWGHNYTDALDTIFQAVRINSLTGEAMVVECAEETLNPLLESGVGDLRDSLSADGDDTQHAPLLGTLSELVRA